MNTIFPNNIVPAMPAYDADGKLYYPTVVPASSSKQTMLIYKIPDRAIPVIFLPGVMGSNLKTKDKKNSDELWRLDSMFSPKGWLFKGATKRKKLLDPKKVLVDPEGRVDDDLAEPGFDSRQKRGWGEAAYISYGDFLPWLQRSLNDFDNIDIGERVKLIDDILDLDIGSTALTRDEVKLSYKYLFPLHVVGYNWLDTIEESAKVLLKQIDKIISDYHSKKIKCEKVILVTHSMGGLVARYCSELTGGNSKILGIVHGVMPALGAASAYRRMKSGMEYDISNFNSWGVALVAGSNAAEMTAVLSQSPGPLQLLPGMEYGMQWFKIKDGEQTYSLPKTNPYDDIYTVRGKWWSMCEENLINPANVTLNKSQLDNDWLNYTTLIYGKVKHVIEDLAGRYHGNTHAFYGNETPTFSELIWKGETNFLDKSLPKGRPHFPLKGKVASTANPDLNTARSVLTPFEGDGWQDDWQKVIRQRYQIQAPTDLGDGTVPVHSSKIPEHYLQSRVALPVEHEPAYKHPAAQKYTLWAIVKIAQKVKQTSLRYPDD